MNLNRFKQNRYDPIKIKEPLQINLKTFESTDEFTMFYRQNPDEFKNNDKTKLLSANLLNRMFKIPGYRIRITNKGKDNEELILVKDYGYYTQLKSENDNSETDNLNSELLQRNFVSQCQFEELTQSLMDKIRQVEDLQGHFQEMANILTKRLDNVETYLEQLK